MEAHADGQKHTHTLMFEDDLTTNEERAREGAIIDCVIAMGHIRVAPIGKFV